MGWIRNFVNRFRPSKIVRREIDAAMNRWLRDIDFGLRLRAILDSADFVYEHIPLHKRFDPVALRKKRSICAGPRAVDGVRLAMCFAICRGSTVRITIILPTENQSRSEASLWR